MINVGQLNLGHVDASEYNDDESKHYFDEIFLNTVDTEKVKNRSIYFILGEKGTGKTAIAVYYSNNEIDGSISKLYSIESNDMENIINNMKSKDKLRITYTDMWRGIIAYWIAKSILQGKKRAGTIFLSHNERQMQKYISLFEDRKKDTEYDMIIKTAIEKQASTGLGRFFEQYFNLSGEIKNKKEVEESLSVDVFTSVYDKLIDIILESKIDKHINIFIDGLDSKPVNAKPEEYARLISGIGHAVVEINRRLKTRRFEDKKIRVIALSRIDVFELMNLQNANAKLRSNCVILNWFTSESELKDSPIYRLLNNVFSWQQGNDIRDYVELYLGSQTLKFMLRSTLYRPRDIITFLQILKEHTNSLEDRLVSPKNSSQAQSEYSDYFLGEIKDSMQIHLSNNDSRFSDLIDFFTLFGGRYRFNMEFFDEACETYKNQRGNLPFVCKNNEELLQLLYDNSVIGFTYYTQNGDRFQRWSYREKTINDLQPSISIGDNVEYSVHRGLRKALKLGLPE